jgi:hypothetical protein
VQRQVYLDNLKVLLIAAIIALHAILGNAATIDVWPYASVREVTLWPPAEAVLLWWLARSRSSSLATTCVLRRISPTRALSPSRSGALSSVPC